MANETVAKIQSDYNAQKVFYETGDRVQMVSGQYQSLRGQIIQLLDNKFRKR